MGGDPYAVLRLRNGEARLDRTDAESELSTYTDPLDPLAALLAEHRSPAMPELPLPRFMGGAVGYLSYEGVRAFEPRVPSAPGAGLDLPDSLWTLVDGLLVFDHLARTISAVAHVHAREHEAHGRRSHQRR